MLGELSNIWFLVQIFLVLSIFGFVRNWTGNTTLSLIITGILAYIFVFKYGFLGVGWLILSNIFMIILFAWVISVIK